MTTRNISPDRASAMLAQVKEFRDLPPKDLDEVVQACHWVRFDEGQCVVRHHDDSNSVFFIGQGSIRVTYYSLSGHEVILCDMLVGEMFGELTAIDGLPRSATVIARTPALLASMSADTFLNLIYSNKKIAEIILKRLTGQVRRLTERVYDFSTLAVRDRIHTELLRLAKDHMVSSNEAIISPAPTHSDIANLVSTHREAVTRELNALVREKLILRHGRDLHILDVSKLKKMIEDVRGDL